MLYPYVCHPAADWLPVLTVLYRYIHGADAFLEAVEQSQHFVDRRSGFIGSSSGRGAMTPLSMKRGKLAESSLSLR